MQRILVSGLGRCGAPAKRLSIGSTRRSEGLGDRRKQEQEQERTERTEKEQRKEQRNKFLAMGKIRLLHAPVRPKRRAVNFKQNLPLTPPPSATDPTPPTWLVPSHRSPLLRPPSSATCPLSTHKSTPTPAVPSPRTLQPRRAQWGWGGVAPPGTEAALFGPQRRPEAEGEERPKLTQP